MVGLSSSCSVLTFPEIPLSSLSLAMGYNKSEEKPKQKPKSKPKHRKGLWSPDEDMRLRSYILQHGHGCWSSVPINAGLQRNGKSCRLRWINYLRPGLKRGTFTVQEEGTIIFLHDMFGNKWSQIAQHLPGRTDNEIKNYWHSYLKKRASSKVEVVMDSQAKIENYNSPPESIESSLSPKKPESQSPNLNSYENTEGSSTDTDQIFLQSSFPRILFAEWLPVDHVYGKKMDSSAVCSLPKENLDHSSQFQDDFVDELNGGAFGDGFNGWLTNASAYEIFSSQFHQQDIGNDFMESIASDEICSQFNIINDEMYLQADFRN